jgi:hypothetical protein
MPEKQLVSVLAIFYHRNLPRFAFTGHCSAAPHHHQYEALARGSLTASAVEEERRYLGFSPSR